MNTYTDLNRSLVASLVFKTHLTPERIKAIMLSRLVRQTEAQRVSKLSKRKQGQGLTEYSRSLMEGKYLSLYNLLLDYTGNRTDINALLHDTLMRVRAERVGNVRYIIHKMLVDDINKYIEVGAVRYSDKRILAIKY